MEPLTKHPDTKIDDPLPRTHTRGCAIDFESGED